MKYQYYTILIIKLSPIRDCSWLLNIGFATL